MNFERLEDDGRKGYRARDNEVYAFFDIFWEKVSEHYLIQQRYRYKQHVQGRPPKDIIGPVPIEIMDPNISEDTVDKRCLDILKKDFGDATD